MPESQEQHGAERSVDLLRFSTAGSVDDGKSTLIGRLLYESKAICTDTLASVEAASRRLSREEVDLALLTDGLKAEREQGITIDVAYRYFATPRRRFIIADSPGHEQYTRNMVTGASTADLIIILIDARNGITTQSKRHSFVASLMAIPHVVVAVNKMDLVGYREDAFRAIREEFSDFAAKLEIGEMTFLPVSALHNENVVSRSRQMPWFDGPTLLGHLETVSISSNRNLIDFRFPVQFVNRPNSSFRGLCGTIASGVVRPGEAVTVLPGGRKTRVKSICTFDGEHSYAFAPQAVTLTLEDEVDVSRGDMLVHCANQPAVCRSAEAMIVWMDQSPLQIGQPYLIKHTTSLMRGSVAKLHYRVDPNTLHRQDAGTLELNEIGRAEMEFFRPIHCDVFRRNRQTGGFILIDPATNHTAGCGMIIRCGEQQAATEAPAAEVRQERTFVTRQARQAAFGQKAVTLWLTGLSGSGKSTIARRLEKRLFEAGHPAYMLDGDNLRHGLNRGLGFSLADRAENIRRAAEAARLLNDAGLIVIASFISPLESDRRGARQILGKDRFLEIHVHCPLEICEQRDVKGLYKRARAGEIPQFTGISSPYEAPTSPDLLIATDRLNADEAVEQLMALLKARGILSPNSKSETRNSKTES